MAYAKIPGGSVGAGSTTGNNVTTGAIDTTGADLIVLLVVTYDGWGTQLATDSKSNVYTQRTSYQSTDMIIQVQEKYAPTVGSGHTFTVTTTSGFPSIIAIAFSGAKSSPFDQINGAVVVSDVQRSTGSVTPTEDNELLVAGLAITPGTITNLTIDSGFTKDVEIAHVSGQHFGLNLAYLIQGSAAAVNPLWAWTTSREAAATIATFKSLIVGPGTGADSNALQASETTQPVRALITAEEAG